MFQAVGAAFPPSATPRQALLKRSDKDDSRPEKQVFKLFFESTVEERFFSIVGATHRRSN